MQKIENNMSDLGDSALSGYRTVSPYLDLAKIAIVALFLILIILIGLGMVAALLMKACAIQCCRHILHMSWVGTIWVIFFSLFIGVTIVA